MSFSNKSTFTANANISTKGFSILPNKLIRNGKILSDSAFRLLAYLLSNSETWIVYQGKMRSDLDWGRDKMQGYIKELEEKKYLRRTEVRSKDGRFSHHDYEFFTEPFEKNSENSNNFTDTVFSGTGLSGTGKPEPTKTNLTKTKLTKSSSSVSSQEEEVEPPPTFGRRRRNSHKAQRRNRSKNVSKIVSPKLWTQRVLKEIRLEKKLEREKQEVHQILSEKKRTQVLEDQKLDAIVQGLKKKSMKNISTN